MQQLIRSGTLQAKRRIGQPGDIYEQEADRVADTVMRMQTPQPVTGSDLRIQRIYPACEEEVQMQPMEEEEELQGKATSGHFSDANPDLESHIQSLEGGGHPLSENDRTFFEPRFGQGFSPVRLHTDGAAAELSRNLGARAFTVQNDIFFGDAQFRPGTTGGKHLLAHELTHVVQQGRLSRDRLWSEPVPAIQREANQPATEEEQLTRPLTDREWQRLELWQSRGEVGIDPLTENPNHNALVVAEVIFCSRILLSLVSNDTGEDPLLCIIPEVTRADARVQRLAQHVTTRGPIINWTRVDRDQRILHVMELLVNQYHYPVNGAAGIVGNLMSESGVLPTRIERSGGRLSDQATPLTERDFAGRETDFTAEQVMNRDRATRQGPRRPGIGLAQWTTEPRRSDLFQHTFQGRQLGAAILFNMDAQVDFLVSELQTRFGAVNTILTGTGVSLNAASDEVVYRFEVPGAVLDEHRNLRPRNDPAVQAVFASRRANSQRALQVFSVAHP